VSDRIAKGDPPLYESRHPGWPTKVTISLPDNHCNIGGDNPTPETACIMCGRAQVGYTRAADNTDAITDRVRPLMDRLRVLGITGVAEAFWKDRLFQVLDRLGFSRFADRILVETNSNGTTLSSRVRKHWLESCPRSHLVVSIDAATSETYRKIRRLDAYDTIIANVRGYVRERDRSRQALYLFHNINLLNVREVEAMVETAADLGVDGVNLTLTWEWNDQIRPYLISEDTALLFARAHTKAVQRAEQLGVNLSFTRFLYGDYPQLVTLMAS
jgi:MoaA/NifB/PqqE/SkfB family radical SAM enzyme